jgi:hypothetical protein
MLVKSQLLFILKVFLISAIASFLIKYGLGNWLINDNQMYLALVIILSPVLSLLIILWLRHKQVA